MLENINDSKKSYFIWLFVTITLVVGLLSFLFFKVFKDEDINMGERILASFVCSYICGTFPLGWTVKRRLMELLCSRSSWYVHVPTEQLKIGETNLVIAWWRLIKVQFLAVMNLFLLCLYCCASTILGILFTPYFIISGIVFLIKGKI